VRLLKRVRTAWQISRLRSLRVSLERCLFCDFPILVKFNDNEHAVRCISCGANPVAMSVVAVMGDCIPELAQKAVYELAASGPLHDYLARRCRKLICSEYLDGVTPGTVVNGVECQDVQHLTYATDSFDVCVCTEVFEHVPDDARGFSEIHRVLQQGAVLVLTIPLHGFECTRERARLVDGQVELLLSPEYHDDPIRGSGTALVYRDYGTDLGARLHAAGFREVRFVAPPIKAWWGFGRTVVLATN
jgi:SAM-dependent methyltransferase